MYQPTHLAEKNPRVLQALIRARPLGLLVAHGVSGLSANPIPFILDLDANVLRCHVARANEQWREIGSRAEVLVVFQGADHYVHPGWYETKRETGKVVPTWNYAMVQVRGLASAREDAAWLARQVHDMTEMMEGRYPDPWSVGDAPTSYIEAQLRGIVGIEVAITSMAGKWKVSQNRSEGDRRGVVDGLCALDDQDAREMAGLVGRGLAPCGEG